MKSLKFIDAMQEKHGLKNDYAVSRFLGIASGTISQYRNGKRIMDNEMCLKIALALEIDPIQVIMAADIDRAEKAGQRSLWEDFLTKAGVSVKNNLTRNDQKAAPRLADKDAGICIMSNWRHMVLAMLAQCQRVFCFASRPATA